MGEEQKIKSLVITEKEREFSTSINDEEFVVRIPLPFEKSLIIAQTSRGLGGQDIKSFSAEDYEYVRMIITLNNVVVKSPKWWEGAGNCPDDTILIKLWNHYLNSEEKFQDFLKKNINTKGQSGQSD
jgi:hypothetical protein